MKNNLIFKLLLAFTLLVLVSCTSEDQKVEQERDLSPETQAIVQEADFVEALIATKQILRRSSVPDREGIRNGMIRIKGLLAYLDRNPGNTEALGQLKVLLLDFQSFNLSERDAPRVSNLIQRMNSKYVEFASAAGFDTGKDFAFTLYQYDFVKDLAPFGISSPDGSDAWDEPIERLNIYRFSAKSGRGVGVSWLISPTFDFTNVKNPGLRLKHSFNINENQSRPSFDPQLIKSKAFNVYYSENFVSGLHNHPSVEWKKLDIGKLPLGSDFHAVDTGYMRYKEFEGKKITIALAFDVSHASVFGHYLNWDLFRFDILGMTKDFSYKAYDPTIIPLPVEPSLYSWDVDDLKDFALDGFEQVIVEGNPGNFRSGDFEGDFYIRGSGKDQNGSIDLVTPMYDLSVTTKPYIQVVHAAKFYPANIHSEKLISLWIAEEKEGAGELEWIDLNLNTDNIGNSYREVPSEKLSIPESLIGKKVRFAFRWTGKGVDKTPVWDIHSFRIGELND